MENEKIEYLKCKISQTESEIEQISKTMVDLRAYLEVERYEGVVDPARLEATITETQNEMDIIQAEIDKAMTVAEENKDILNELKLKYEELPDAEKPEAWQKLSEEVNSRGAQINEMNSKIDVLETEKIEVLRRLTLAKQKLAAFNAGVFSLPIEEDPRMKSLEVVYREATERLKEYEKSIEELTIGG